MQTKTILSFLYFIGWCVVVCLNTFMVFNDNEKIRMMLLIGVIVIHHGILILFMVEYETMSRYFWKKKEKKLIEKLTSNKKN